MMVFLQTLWKIMSALIKAVNLSSVEVIGYDELSMNKVVFKSKSMLN